MSDDDEIEEEDDESEESGSFSIRVVNKHGEPVPNARVMCVYGKICGVGKEYTDDEGWATFPIITSAILERTIMVESIDVDGQEVESEGFFPEDGDTFSYTVDY